MKQEVRDRLGLMLDGMNPWWTSGKGPFAGEPPVAREELAGIIGSMDEERATSIIGPRQVGKTTLMLQCVEHLIEERGVPADRVLFVDMDRPYLLSGLERHLNDILDVYGSVALGGRVEESPELVWIFLDEVCTMPDWERVLKGWVDMRTNARFVFSDSSITALVTGHTKAMTGRVDIMRLGALGFRDTVRLSGNEVPVKGIERIRGELVPALAAGEIDRVRDALSKAHSLLYNLKTRIEGTLRWYILWGGYPGLVRRSDEGRARELDLIADLTLSRDVVEVYGVREPQLLKDLAGLLAHEISGQLNVSNVSRDLAHDRSSVERHIGYLVESGIVVLSPQYTGKARSSARKEKKIRMRSPGLSNVLASVHNPNVFEKSGRPPHVMESVVAMHMHSLEVAGGSSWLTSPRFWKDQSGEVDVVVEFAGTPLPVEVKQTSAPGSRDRKAVGRFMERWDAPVGIVAHTGEINLDTKVMEVPLWLLLMLC
jgi:predicted AAA+ superfamily ATPase